MHRFFVPAQNISSGKIVISDARQAHHLRDVLRLKPKEEVIVSDGSGHEYRCLIKKISDTVILEILNRDSDHFPKMVAVPIKLTVACAIPKNSKFDDIVDKLTQIGVDAIIPLLTERVIVKLDKAKQALRLKRWEAVALSASRQCQRSTIPVVSPIKKIKDVLEGAQDFDLKLIPTLSGERKTLKELLNRDSAVPNILVLIGPEGDFSDEEVRLAEGKGFIPVSLGNLVLRVETAAVATASFIRFYFDENI